MYPPLHTKAFSDVFGKDPRLLHIEQDKQENRKTQEYLAEIAAAKAELIEKIPFDTDEQNLIINRISCQFDHLYTLIENNPQITKQYLKNA